MNIELREVALPGEIDALLAFDRKAFANFPADLFDAEDWAQFKSHWMIVDGEIVGCSAIVRDEDFDETSKPGSLWIASTGILPEHRRKGLGQMLKEWQIGYAREHGFRVIVTNMRKSNSPIIRLNTRLGFTIREISPEYYSDPPEDAIVMELEL
jgi:ribosomal protein S18 acetylase RimI-like enzyme